MTPSIDALDERVLVLAPVGRDGELACRLLEEHGVGAHRCRDVDALVRELARGAGALLVADEALSEAALAALLPVLAAQPAWSDLPLIVISNQGAPPAAAHETLKRVEQLGHVSLLDRPVRLFSLVSITRTALRARRRQYEARDMLLRLKDGVEQRDRFLAMLGHELRNPLAAIVYGASLLARRPDPGARQMIERQAHHLSRLVDELLDVSRVTSGKIVLQRAVVNLREVVKRSVESVRPRMQALTLRVDVANEPLPVEVDAMRMEQVITNLLTNALKYTPNGGRVTVSAGLDAGYVSVRIEDDGVGIPPEMLSKIFDLFIQVDGSLDRSGGGLGIGLTIVRALVELHGGQVRAASDGPGRGTRVEVRLPAARGDVPLPQVQVRLPAREPLTPSRRVLVVDDDEDVREVLRELLEAEGFDVEAAAEGSSAVARAHATLPEIALVDIGLPGMNGYEVARAIRRDLGENIYIAALSGYGQPEDRAKSYDAGFDAHLTKPVDIEVVTRMLREACR